MPPENDDDLKSFPIGENAKSKEELGDKFVDLATNEFQNSVAAEDLQKIEQMLSEQLEEDPYLQGKLDRIFSLLAKAK